MGSQASNGTARFAGFELDLRTGELRKNGHLVRLQAQPLKALRVLLEHPGELVTREQLRREVWPQDTFVDFDHGLNKAVAKLRDAVDESDASPSFIETLPRLGYRFIPTVEWSEKDLSSNIVSEPDSESQDGGGNGESGPPVVEPSQVPKKADESPSPTWWKRKSTVAAMACLAGAGLLYPFVTPEIEHLWTLRELQQLKVVPLTALPGIVASPTFSPDGSQVAFAWDGENSGEGYDLYVKVVGSDEPLRLTHHPSPRLSAAWSPDGRNIALSRIAGEDSGIYLIAATGGPERKLATRDATTWYGNEISWSTDGKHLAFIDHPANPVTDVALNLFLLSLDTLDKTPVDTTCNSAATPAFSPRGTFLAWVCNETFFKSSLRLLRLKDGNQTQLLARPDGIGGPAWSSDERRIVFSAGSNYGSLWEVSLARPSQIEMLPVGHDASDLAAKPAGLGLAYVQGSGNMNIWRLDLLASPPQARKLVSSSRDQTAPSISPDGSKIAFESTRSGEREIWVCDADGSSAQQLTRFGQDSTGTPRWSPDGTLIAFDSRVGGEANVYLVDPRGGVPHELNIDIHGNNLPSWSRDGSWIYFTNGFDANNPSVWKVPSNGGHAVQVAKRGAFFPIESPDGEYVYFAREKKLWRAKTDGSTEQPVAGMPEFNFLGDEWYPTEGGIYFLSHPNNKTVINLFDVQTMRVRPIFTLEKPAPPWIGGMPVSKDGKFMLFPQVDQASSDLMLIENWR